MHRWVGWAASIIMLLATITFQNDACPSVCTCSTWVAKCIGKGLKTVPRRIPLTATLIDLSNNPSMYIPRDYFVKFKQLYKLNLNNCGQKGPLTLPTTLRSISIDYNLFTIDALREMLSTTKLLRQFSLTYNNLQHSDVQQVLRILPSTLEDIDLSRNELHRLTNKDIGRFKRLKIFSLSYCGLKSIEVHAFDNVRKMGRLWLNANALRYLPKNLFANNAKLTRLDLTNNKLSVFNATKLGLKTIFQLSLSTNQIAALDVTTVQFVKLFANDNRIQILQRQMFNSSPFLGEIYLQNNNINFISKYAFQNTKRLGQLLLQNNNITSIPREIFKGMYVDGIFLQHNHLRTLNGAFEGILPGLQTLDISENTGLRTIDGTDLAQLPVSSQIYLTCNNMRTITALSKIKGKILCTPNADMDIRIPTEVGMKCKGYVCTFDSEEKTSICRACRRGYYTACKNSKICVQCPSGSYYQDQQASYTCKICRPGQFVPPERSPGTDPLDCQTCPQGTNTSIIAGTRACKCLHGYSRRYRFGPCHKCNHNGFECEGRDYQILKNGFWMTWKGTKQQYTNNTSTPRNHNETTTICQHMYNQFVANLDVTDDTYNRSTMHFKCQMPLPIKCPMFDSCLGGIHPTCSRGYNGVLCAVCDRGYIPQFNQCIQCPQPLWASLQFIGYIALFVIFCFIISLTDQIIIDESQTCLQRNEQYDHRTLTDIILSSLKILIGFYQIFISIMHAFSNIHWPRNLKTVTNILQYVQFQIIKLPSLRCIKPQWNINAIDEFWIMFIIIITIPLLSVLYYFIKSIYTHFQYLAPSVAKHKRYICARNCIKYVALFLFVTYPLISTKIIQILPISCHSFCTVKHNDNCIHSMSFLRSDYSIPCPTMADHKVTLITGYICLLIPFGLPGSLFMLLRSYAPTQRRSTYQPITNMMEHKYSGEDIDNLCDLRIATTNDDDNENLSGDSTVPVITSALKFSYENYHVRYWYWEVIEMIRKLLMTIGIGLFLGHTKIGLTCTLIVAMIFTVLHAIIKPLKNNFESATQFVSLVLVPLNLAYGAVRQSQDTQNASIISKEKDSYYEGIFLVIINSTLIIIVIIRIIMVIGKTITARCGKSK